MDGQDPSAACSPQMVEMERHGSPWGVWVASGDNRETVRNLQKETGGGFWLEAPPPPPTEGHETAAKVLTKKGEAVGLPQIWEANWM